jgi:hypothetical protein
MTAIRYDDQTGKPNGVVLNIAEMRGRRPDRLEQPAGVLKLQFRDADGFTVTLILADLAQVQAMRALLT